MTPKCSICGKFAIIVDGYIPFGSYNDLEPPEAVIMCEKCTKEKINYYKENNYMPNNWIPANFEEMLANELGYEWHINEGGGWGCWKKREKKGNV